jgi:hypothetical protein
MQQGDMVWYRSQTWCAHVSGCSRVLRSRGIRIPAIVGGAVSRDFTLLRSPRHSASMIAAGVAENGGEGFEPLLGRGAGIAAAASNRLRRSRPTGEIPRSQTPGRPKRSTGEIPQSRIFAGRIGQVMPSSRVYWEAGMVNWGNSPVATDGIQSSAVRKGMLVPSFTSEMCGEG